MEQPPLDDESYREYVREKIEQGIEDEEAGRIISHAEVQERLATSRVDRGVSRG
jgi:predicted transcriptional regulator